VEHSVTAAAVYQRKQSLVIAVQDLRPCADAVADSMLTIGRVLAW
jgi:hypothetical protein